jgi:nitroreductase/NAD-dependent dihydropyrimidine dehydrogenase PreA subunit
MAIVEFNRETCTKCGNCSAVCSWSLIVLREDNSPGFFPGVDEFCIHCGQCVAVCPTGSVRHQDIPVEECSPIAKKQEVSFTQASSLIKTRRSIRVFKDKPVPRELLESVIDIARYAPTADNFEEVKWLIIDNKAEFNKLNMLSSESFRLVSENRAEPWSNIRYVDTPWPEFFKRIPRMLELGIGFKTMDEPARVITYAESNNPLAAIDCVIALSYFDLAAKAAGLGCCWAGAFSVAAQAYDPLKKALGVPEDFKVYGALYVGYPEYTYHRIPLRKPAHITYLNQ